MNNSHSASYAAAGVDIEAGYKGVQLMKEGAKYSFFIPSDLAYGAQGIPNAIPPHSTLIFDVELIKVNHKSDIII